MQRIDDAICDVAGNALENASVYVYLAGTPTPATLYSDNGVTPIAQPVVSDYTGMFTAYAANGHYDIKVIKTGYADTWYRDVLLEDPNQGNNAGQNSSGALITVPGASTPVALSTAIGNFVVADSRYGIVGDGVADDTAALSTLLNASAGKTVIFPDGSNCLIASTVTVSAAGIVISGGKFTRAASFSGARFFILGAQNITFSNCTFIGGTTSINAIYNTSYSVADGAVVENCSFDAFGSAVTLFRTNNVRISGNKITNGSSVDIYCADLAPSQNIDLVIITDNVISSRVSTIWSAIYVGPSSASYEYTNVVVKNNLIYNSVATTSADVGVTIRRCTGGKVINNTTHYGSMGISVDSSMDCIVKGNHIHNPSYYGIELPGSSYGNSSNVIVNDNFIECNGVAGIAGWGTIGNVGAIVNGNTIIGTTTWQPIIFNDSWAKDIIITDNYISCTTTHATEAFAIYIRGHVNVPGIVTNVVISGNIIRKSSAFAYGICLRSCSFFTVQNNVISNGTVGSILIDGTLDSCDVGVISGNVMNSVGGATGQIVTTGTVTNIAAPFNPGFGKAGELANIAMLRLENDNSISWSGSLPEGVTSAGVGSLHVGTNIPYYKYAGASTTGWIPVGLAGSSTTANRPTASLFVGMGWYDTTLAKPIWVKSLSPTVWQDATGAVV